MVRRLQRHAMRVGTQPPADRDPGNTLHGEKMIAAIEAGRFDQLPHWAPSPPAAAPHHPWVPHG